MSQTFQNISLGLDEVLEEKLALLSPGFSSFRILRRSVDARRRHQVHEVLSVEVFGPGEKYEEEKYAVEPLSQYKGPPVCIVGSGPAGLFAALRLVERGIPCRLFERGSSADARIRAINKFWRYGELNTEDNICFGEGGAGLYSDGKLITRIKSPHIPYVLNRLVKFGAPQEIQYLSNPHVGSDRIRRVIPLLREFLVRSGCEIYFNTKVTELLSQGNKITGIQTEDGREFSADQVILATGHSANDVFKHLHQMGVFMEGKSFAIGLRIEHPQKLINQIQYHGHPDHPRLGSANYKLTHHDSESGIGVYSFCMCPGGYILSSGTETDGIVCNGMSNFHRNSPFANAAIVVSIDHQKNFGDSIFGGMEFRRKIEKAAFEAVQTKGGTKQLPVQSAMDFLRKKASPSALPSSTPSGTVSVRLDQILPNFVVQRISDGLMEFDKKMGGFAGPLAQLHGVETRTSCPLRITRHPETFESLSHSGLYPAGEGAGYAGGITSAAVDGVQIADRIYKNLCSQTATFEPHVYR